MGRKINGTQYIDVVHIKKRGSIRATGMDEKGAYTHTCPDDVLQFLKQYFDGHGYASMKELKDEYDGPAMRIPIGVALMVKQGRIKPVGTLRGSPVFTRPGWLPERILGWFFKSD